jgi:hypothetical protein
MYLLHTMTSTGYSVLSFVTYSIVTIISTRVIYREIGVWVIRVVVMSYPCYCGELSVLLWWVIRVVVVSYPCCRDELFVQFWWVIRVVLVSYSCGCGEFTVWFSWVYRAVFVSNSCSYRDVSNLVLFALFYNIGFVSLSWERHTNNYIILMAKKLIYC